MSIEWQREATLPRGVLVASDENLEWLLPWWWENYEAASNSYPVIFVDFGMTEEARTFCREHGELIDFAFYPGFVKEKDALHADVKAQWKNYGETFWQARSGWFKKPLALLHSRYHLTLWLDLDCEIMQPLDPLFSLLPPHEDFAIAPEPLFYQGGSDRFFGEVLYNSGVMLFRHGAKLIQKWGTRAFHENGQFQGDQELLSRIIHEEGAAVFELPEIYNARLVTGIPLHATIIHWVGNWGKAYIRQNGGLHCYLTGNRPAK